MSSYSIFRREQRRLSGVRVNHRVVRVVIGLWHKFHAPALPLRLLYYTVGADV